MRFMRKVAVIATFGVIVGLVSMGSEGSANAQPASPNSGAVIVAPTTTVPDRPCPQRTLCPPPLEPECDMITTTDENGDAHIEYHGDGCPPPPEPECGETVYWIDPDGEAHSKYGGDCPPPPGEPEPECGETVTWVDDAGKEHSKYGGDCPTTKRPPVIVDFPPYYTG